MRMVRWMCDVKVKERVPSKELTETLRTDRSKQGKQNKTARLRWYGHVLQKENTDWVKNMVEAPDKEVDQRGHGQRLCKKIAKHIILTGRTLWIIVAGRS